MTKKISKVDINIGPNMRKKGAVKNMILGITLGTVVFFVVCFLAVYR
jgi:hypothetical protein